MIRGVCLASVLLCVFWIDIEEMLREGEYQYPWRTDAVQLRLHARNFSNGWSTWSPWQGCPVTCGIGLEIRERTCTDFRCQGDFHDPRICFSAPCADGGWSTWENWGSCSGTCGVGLRYRSRQCTNPTPSLLGRSCQGSSEQTEICGKVSCHEQSPMAGSCPKGYKYSYKGSCYFLSRDLESWTGAMASCSILEGQLVEIETLEELEYLRGLASNISVTAYSRWIGLSNKRTGYEWEWVTSQTVLSNTSALWNNTWADNQPDDSFGGIGYRGCALMDAMNGHQYHMANVKCDGSYGYICEFTY